MNQVEEVILSIINKSPTNIKLEVVKIVFK